MAVTTNYKFHLPPAPVVTPAQPVTDSSTPLKATNLKQHTQNWLLDKLQEEAAEVIQAVSKIRRFGEANTHPERKTTNHQELVQELEDFLAIVAALEHVKYFDLTKHQNQILKKTQALISS